MDPRIPDKLYFRIGEVATIVGVAPYVLRFWETEFPSLRPGKSPSGQRTYAAADVEMALRIRDLVHGQGFTLAGARKALGEGSRSSGGAAARPPTERPSPRTRGLIDRVRFEVEALLRVVEE